jgi:hypothetical protein
MFKQPRKKSCTENQDIIVQSGNREGPTTVSPNGESETDFIPTLADSVRIILFPGVTAVDFEHNLMHKICFLYPKNFI